MRDASSTSSMPAAELAARGAAAHGSLPRRRIIHEQQTSCDPRAFARIAKKIRPDLYRYAIWLSGDRSFVEDVVQEALICGRRSLHELTDHGSVKQWLLAIVRRECARHSRCEALDIADTDGHSGAHDAPIAAGKNPDIAGVRQAIFGLEQACREPLVLQVLMGCSASEIGELMGLTPEAVSARLSRARRILAALVRA